MFKFNSREEKHKKPFGALATEQAAVFSIFAKDGVFVYEMQLVINFDGAEAKYYDMKFSHKEDGYSVFKLVVNFEAEGLYWYSFRATTERGVYQLYKGQGGQLVGACEGFNQCYQLSVFNKKFVTPDFIKGGLIYHIFVDRFAKGEDCEAVFCKNGVLKSWGQPVTLVDPDGVFRANDFYGGNFQGIIDKIDYLSQLGVTLLYLSPIFKSGSNHRYDTGDYMQLDELLGTEQRFAELLKKAKAAGIEVMLDGVFNHTGADSLYFNKFGNYDSVGAFQSKKSPYASWFHFSDFPQEYDCWWGITVTPTVNKSNPQFTKLIAGADGVIEKYTRLGVKGWRLDVVDELRSEFVEDIRHSIKQSDPDALLIGEVWEDASNKISYSLRRPYLFGSELDGTMNYPFKQAIHEYVCQGGIENFAEQVTSIRENYPKQCLDASMVLIDTHDTWRAINSFAQINVSGMDKQAKSQIIFSPQEWAAARSKLKIAAILQYSLEGAPSLYYGDEVGLDGYDDPLNRKPFPWDNIDLELLSFYRRLGIARKNYRKAFSGDFEFFNQEGVLGILRSGDSQRVLVVANNSNSEKAFVLPSNAKSLIDDKRYEEGIIVLASNQADMLVLI